MSIECAVLGTAVKDTDLRTSNAGKQWLSVILRSDGGDAAQFVQVAIFGEAAIAIGRIERGERIYAEGAIRLNQWTAPDGTQRHGLSMASWKAERPGIGRNRQRQQDQKPQQSEYYRPQQERRPQQEPPDSFWNDQVGY
jgi:single-stranded DNA-binding protein